MEELRQWILSVSVCAILLGVLRRFLPQGATGEATRFALGLAMLVVLLAPVKRMDTTALLWDFSTYEEECRRAQEALTSEWENAVKQGIERQTEEYISAKGFRARVEAEYENGLWLPRRAIIWGERTAEAERWLSQDLGITQMEWRGDG